MLLGQMPGDAMSRPSTLFATLPSYATLVGQYLNRFGPYRLQPYAVPPAPPSPPSMPVVPPAPAGQPAMSVREYTTPTYGEAHGAAERNSVKAFDPVGAGLGALIGSDRLIDLFDGIANPRALGIGFSNPTGMGLAALGLRELAKMNRRSLVDKINEARRQGLINDANVRVRPGTPIGRAGGVGTPGVSGGFTKEPSKSAAPDRGANDRQSNRGPGSRGAGFGHFGGPR
jgi:hypothetical protein